MTVIQNETTRLAATISTSGLQSARTGVDDEYAQLKEKLSAAVNTAGYAGQNFLSDTSSTAAFSGSYAISTAAFSGSHAISTAAFSGSYAVVCSKSSFFPFARPGSTMILGACESLPEAYQSPFDFNGEIKRFTAAA